MSYHATFFFNFFFTQICVYRKSTHQVFGKLQESKQDHAKNCRFPPNLLNMRKRQPTHVIYLQNIDKNNNFLFLKAIFDETNETNNEHI